MDMDRFQNPLGQQIHVPQIEWLIEQISETMYGLSPDKLKFLGFQPPIWADEPRWTQYHAACWHALRNDNWTHMPFSPKRLGNPEILANPHHLNEKSFFQAASAYAALADILGLGHAWGKTLRTLKEWNWGMIAPHHKNFVKFWYPMLNTYGDWYSRFGLFNWPKESENPENHYTIDPNRPFHNLSNQFEDFHLDLEFGSDPLHITSHSAKPLTPGSRPEIDFTRTNGFFGRGWMEAPPYGILTCESYSGWAQYLLELKVERSALIRVDARVHESMTAYTTLGHFLVKVHDPYGDSSTGYNFVHFINDLSIARFLQTGDFDLPKVSF